MPAGRSISPQPSGPCPPLSPCHPGPPARESLPAPAPRACRSGRRRRTRRALPLLTVLALLAGGGLATILAGPLRAAEGGLPAAAGGEPKLIDRSKVYYGKPGSFKKPAVIRAKTVIKRTPSYRKIIKEGLKKDDARYHILIARANKEFAAVVTRVAKEKGFDLVAEVGAIVVEGKKLTDLTQVAVEKLKDSK